MGLHGLKFEIIIRDENWRKIEVLKSDYKNFHKIAYILFKKYDLSFFKPNEKEDKDLDWLKGDNW